ncbi:patatin-like protein 1 [Tanacetum coccineum]|uniref:Patatin n=1 Tax=Tanacetum coccineum TaxID=301880 RepID=A0ABQ5C546_9ASTR
MKGPRYDGKYLKDLVDKLLGPTKLNQTLTKVVIPTFDLKDMHPVIFSSYEASANSSKNAKLSDICLGTSAVPTYLPAYYFKNYYDAEKYREYNLIDGGIVANNLDGCAEETTTEGAIFEDANAGDNYLRIQVCFTYPQHA